MTANEEQIQRFVSRELAWWIPTYQPGPWLTQETAARFEASAEQAAISYLEEHALTDAVTAVIGAGNPATPFIVAGLKQVLDAERPAVVRFFWSHPEAGVAGAFAFVWLCWRYGPQW